jgi:phage baseplate assembly protein W
MALQSEITSTDWTLDINNAGKIVQGIDNIKQCVYIIVTTTRGTDPLRPGFGCGAFEHVDLPVNIAAPKMVKSIQDALKKYEPRIDNVKVIATVNLEHITFKISWAVKNTTINDQLDVTYGRGSST